MWVGLGSLWEIGVGFIFLGEFNKVIVGKGREKIVSKMCFVFCDLFVFGEGMVCGKWVEVGMVFEIYLNGLGREGRGRRRR